MRVCTNYELAVMYAGHVADWMKVRAGTFRDRSVVFSQHGLETCMNRMHEAFRPDRPMDQDPK